MNIWILCFSLLKKDSIRLISLMLSVLNSGYAVFFALFETLFALYLFHITHKGPETNTELMHPETRPNAMGMAKVRSVVRP